MGPRLDNLAGSIAKDGLARATDGLVSPSLVAAATRPSPSDGSPRDGVLTEHHEAAAPPLSPTAGLATAHPQAAAGPASRAVALPSSVALAAACPAASENVSFVECYLCKRIYPQDSCVDPDRLRAKTGNRTPRFKCKTCNCFAKALSTTLAGHVGLREQWEEKTAEQRAAWLGEQRLALQAFGGASVVKELTQFFPFPRRRPRPRRRRSRSGSRGTGW